MKRVFFITGFPRSRTAWLANLFTTGPNVCFHDAIGLVESVDDLPRLFESTRAKRVGNADSGFAFYWRRAFGLFPTARVVVVERSKVDAIRSYLAFFGGDPIVLRKAFDRIEEELEALKAAKKVLSIPYAALEQEGGVRQVWEYLLPEVPFDHIRFRLLDGLRINVIPEKKYTPGYVRRATQAVITQ